MSRAFPGAIDGTGGKRKGKGEPPPDDVSGTSGEAQEVLQNSPKLDKQINDLMNEIDNLVAQRKSINEEITALYTEAESLGLNKATFKYLLKVRKFDEDQRLAHEISEKVIRQAIGIPHQGDMFKGATQH